MSVEGSTAQRRRKATSPRRGLRIDLRCSCGSSMTGVVSAPITDAIKMRDIFMAFHREPGCVVADKSEDLS